MTTSNPSNFSLTTWPKCRPHAESKPGAPNSTEATELLSHGLRGIVIRLLLLARAPHCIRTSVSRPKPKSWVLFGDRMPYRMMMSLMTTCTGFLAVVSLVLIDTK